jgi:hypothetical protein
MAWYNIPDNLNLQHKLLVAQEVNLEYGGGTSYLWGPLTCFNEVPVIKSIPHITSAS